MNNHTPFTDAEGMRDVFMYAMEYWFKNMAFPFFIVCFLIVIAMSLYKTVLFLKRFIESKKNDKK